MADETVKEIAPVEVRIQPLGLKAILTVPQHASGIVIFAHGSGSGRLSPRNNYVASALQDAGFATLLLDLLTMNRTLLPLCRAGGAPIWPEHG